MKGIPLCILLAFAAMPALAAEPQQSAPEHCVVQHNTCLADCGDRKVLWFFKGEAYEMCAAACQDDFRECAQGEEQAFEVIRRRPPNVRDDQSTKERVQEQVREEGPPPEKDDDGN